MSSKDLLLRVMLTARDQLSGPLRNIVGLGQSAAQKQSALEKASRDANTELKVQQENIRRAMQEGWKIGDLVEKERELKKRVEETNRQLKMRTDLNAVNANVGAMKNAGANMRSSGMSDIIQGAAIAAPAVFAAKQAMAMESAMAGVRKRIDFESPKEFQQMSDAVVELSTRIPVAADELARIMAAGADAKVGKDELLAFTEDAAKMAVAFDTTADVAGETMAKWRAAFGMGQQGVADLGDKINALTNGRGGKVDAVAGMVTRIGSLGEVSGVYADQIAAMGHVMSSVGVGEEIGATGIKNLMLALNKGTEATKAQQAAFQSLGLDAGQVAKDMHKDAGGAITNVLSRIKELPEHARSGILIKLFGSESVAAISPMLTNLKLLEDNFKLVGDKSKYAGSMNAEFLAAVNTTEGALGLAKNAASAINIELGNMLLPILTEGAREFTELAKGVRAWMKENPAAVEWIGKIVGGLVGLKLGLGVVKIAFGTLLGPIGEVWGVWQKFKILKEAGKFMRFADGARKAGAGLKSAGLWAKVTGKRFAVAGWQYTVMAGKFVLGKVMAAGAALKAAGLWAVATGKRFLYAGWQFTVMAGKFVIGKIGAAVGVLMTVGKAALFMGWSFVKAGLMMLANPIVLIIMGIALAAYLIYKNWDGISAWFGEKWDQVKEKFSAAGDWIIDKWEGVKTFFAALPSWFASIGTNMIDGLKNGLVNAFPNIMAKLRELAKGLPEPIRKFLDIHSPSRLMMQLGSYTAEGMAIGINRGSKAPIRAARAMAAGVAGATFATASMVTPVAASASGPSAPGGTSLGGVTINIYAQPGQSAEDIGAAVQKALQAEAAKAAATRRSSFKDD